MPVIVIRQILPFLGKEEREVEEEFGSSEVAASPLLHSGGGPLSIFCTTSRIGSPFSSQLLGFGYQSWRQNKVPDLLWWLLHLLVVHELALTMMASPPVMVTSAQRSFQQAHMPKQTIFRRTPPKLSLTISKGGDVSQVLTADLRDILHHEDLPGQLIQEVSCHKRCFTGEHNLLVETNGERGKGVNLRRKNPPETPGNWSAIASSLPWNQGISLTLKVIFLWDIVWSWLICIVAFISYNIYIQIQTLEYPSSHLHM